MKIFTHTAFTLTYLFICLILTQNSIAQTISNKNQLSEASRTYGYLLGQDYTLNRISIEHPELETHVIQVKGEFNYKFSNAKERISIALKDALQQSYSTYENKLTSQLDSVLGKQILTRETSIAFIKEVLDRSKGHIPSPIIETLLIYQYNNGGEEFLDNYTYTFKTKGHAKSKGTDWKIKIPRSWKALEAERPNIIQKFTSENGYGNYTIILMVKDLPLHKGYKASEKELLETFSLSNAKGMIPEGSTFISHKRVVIDNQPGMVIESSHTEKRLDLEIRFRMIQYVFIYKNQMYITQGMIAQKSSDMTLEQLSTRFSPLFRLIINSLVLNAQY
ncbi:hypothetical protein HNQ93_002325 [Hymenobacter luteus]|uniref:Uncharacterized protein n=2 Tax=Hymenobacter TaxID=89966 RepID=A0A7W9WCG3_9BACT|nr:MULTISPECIES: hypothetical protein [Hymenobacter]MBB4602106.1 hypothetical protein [Hymenobacter latericoloratus]MBB6059465.1 hypothetical protein [Hymenobacter luteus]